jgi:hypothetical protein
MQQWEYLRAVSRGTNVNWVNGRFLAEQQPIHEWLEEMGQEGWELVAVSISSNDSERLYLKRPKP